MKFARYLKDTQTPEWKRAYIDYRGLKKRITAVKKAQEDFVVEQVQSGLSNRAPSSIQDRSGDLKSPELEDDDLHSNGHISSRNGEAPGQSNDAPSTAPLARRGSTFTGRLPGLVRRKSRATVTRSVRAHVDLNRQSLPLHDLKPLLTPQEADFMTTLDAEFEKIETFYLERENEMEIRHRVLTEQVEELAKHRLRFYAERPQRSWWSIWSRPQDKGKGPALPVTPHTAEPGLLGEFIGSFINQEDYQHAKKQLKKALVEHYLALETLNNYRVLNMTGIRKALKKFEKATGIRVMDAYQSEKVEPSAFASNKTVPIMITQVEEMFSAQFMRGDKKKAKKRLRVTPAQRSHHFNSFRSGMMVGLAIPALASGIHMSFQEETRRSIPGWNSLLLIYAVFLVPVVFSMLVGLNMLVWTKSRVNYVFIFELNPRTRLDPRQYFELPSILLSSLCYAFWLSFAQIGAPKMSPSIWPLVWLGVSAIVLVNPLPWYKSSRYWFATRVLRLLASGTRRVEFTDFWLGDQFCSLVYTLGNLPFVVCHYVDGYDVSWQQCSNMNRVWPASFVLATLPFVIRLVQSIRRYSDSSLNTHLINAGKYGSGLLSYLMYYLWRHQGSPQHGVFFVLWCTFNTAYAFYALTWDFLMDWSIFRPHAPYKFLRVDLIYTNHITVYYVSIIVNTVFRFAWVLYIPRGGLSTALRAFILAMVEIVRRWLWNMYRLENEHIGNMDQYRITREVPLPYSFDDSTRDDADAYEDDDEDSD